MRKIFFFLVFGFACVSCSTWSPRFSDSDSAQLVDDTPFWLLEKGELANYRSTEKLPAKSHVVVIGAGLTGASTAYHLSDAAAKGQNITVLEAEIQPGSQSSGRNGGNFQLLSESYVGSYEGLVQERMKWLYKTQTHLRKKERKERATQEAEALLNFSMHNSQRFRKLVRDENISCDFSDKGWLRIATTREEEEALIRDTEWLNSRSDLMIPTMELWSPEQIRKELKIPASYAGRFVPESGNYHPYKFVTEVLKKSIAKGVKFYTGVRVSHLEVLNDAVRVQTPEGDILADKVIVATNAQTGLLIPELNAIQTVPSQIVNYEHISNTLNGLTVTERGGDIYYNFPLSKHYTDDKGQTRGMLHFGLDYDAPGELKMTKAHTLEMQKLVNERFPDTKGLSPSRMWVGPMAFTEDRVPVIGFFNSKRVIVAAGFQGYGGSYCVQAGYVAAEMAQTGRVHKDVEHPMFSPTRFTKTVSSLQ